MTAYELTVNNDNMWQEIGLLTQCADEARIINNLIGAEEVTEVDVYYGVSGYEDWLSRMREYGYAAAGKPVFRKADNQMSPLLETVNG